MLTYQDLTKVGEGEEERMAFVKKAIAQHKTTGMYKTAEVAEAYNAHKNLTILQYQKILYTVTGKAVPDIWSPNFKMACRHFHRFITQEVQFLLGNGVTWSKTATAKAVGDTFDHQLKEAGKKALCGGVAFGFWNLDHLDVFSVLEFVPLFDETNGALMAGIRFWQIDPDKPIRATLYELDGYTDYIWEDGTGRILREKTAYKLKYRSTPADGTEIYDGENYDGFPIVPFWGNEEHQSEIVGLREQIDCYDLIKSGFANTVDEASIVYWTLQNAGGMDDVDLTKFVERMKTVHAAVVEEDGATAESHTLEPPYASREALLERLNKDLYKDAMALDVENIAAGATTATQIRAAYEPLNSKVDGFEYCALEFIRGILKLAGVDDTATFTRSMIVNVEEEIQTVLQAAQYLQDDYVTRKILTILGDGDLADKMLREMDAESLERMTRGPQEVDEGEEDAEEESET